MSEPRIDPELLAAFLDGMATPAEREEVLRLIAGSREAYAEFSEASAIRGALLGDDAAVDEAGAESEQRDAGGEVPAVVVPVVVPEHANVTGAAPVVASESAPASSRFRFVVPVVMLAAAVLAVVVMTRPKTVAPAGDVFAVAQSVRVPGAAGSGSLARTLGAEWDVPGWTVTRGTEDVAATPHAIAFRVGVRVAQLVVAVQAGDSLATTQTRDQVQSLLKPVEGAGPVAQLLADIRSSSTQAEVTRVSGLLRGLLGQDAWFDLGAWSGSAQLAAQGGDPAFFAADAAAVRALRSLLEMRPEPASEWMRAAAVAAPFMNGSLSGPARTADVLSVLRQLASIAGG